MKVDYVIVGHGLAGACLAWQLDQLGQRVAVLDHRQPHTASRVATGLITPITGKRNSLSYRYEEFLQNAITFYESFTQATGALCLLQSPTFKVVDGEAVEAKLDEPKQARYVGESTTLPHPFRARNAVEFRETYRLDVNRFLNASRRWFEDCGRYFEGELDIENDLAIDQEAIQVTSSGLTARRIIFCQGIRAMGNPMLDSLFGPLPFEPTKGQILQVRSPYFEDASTVLSDIWIAATRNGDADLGATHETDFTDERPTLHAKTELLEKLQMLTAVTPEVIEHRSAIRPVLQGRLPQFAFDHERSMGFFNGLGAKGALRAPWASEQLARYLVHGDPVEEDFWYSPRRALPPKITEQAHANVAKAIQPGDVALDATAGNGFDTIFLSRTVGDHGVVYAGDIQAEAIQRVSQKLEAEGCANVRLIQGSHESLAEWIPIEEQGRVGAIMFNLGYLPRGDKAVTTTSHSTLKALDQCLALLRPQGVLSLVAYPGHAAGYVETLAVEHWLSQLTAKAVAIDRPPTKLTASKPRCYLVHKLA